MKKSTLKYMVQFAMVSIVVKATIVVHLNASVSVAP